MTLNSKSNFRQEVTYVGLLSDIRSDTIDLTSQSTLISILDMADCNGWTDEEAEIELSGEQLRVTSVKPQSSTRDSLLLQVGLADVEFVAHVEDEKKQKYVTIVIRVRECSCDVVFLKCDDPTTTASLCATIERSFQNLFASYALPRTPSIRSFGSSVPFDRHSLAGYSMATTATAQSAQSNSSTQSLEQATQAFMITLFAKLSPPELRKFLSLFTKLRTRQRPVQEIAHKLCDLFGDERTFLLYTLANFLTEPDSSKLIRFLNNRNETPVILSTNQPMVDFQLFNMVTSPTPLCQSNIAVDDDVRQEESSV